jgi:hypothetical protein
MVKTGLQSGAKSSFSKCLLSPNFTFCDSGSQGLPDFSFDMLQNWKNVPNEQKSTKCSQNIPKVRKIFQMAIK